MNKHNEVAAPETALSEDGSTVLRLRNAARQRGLREGSSMNEAQLEQAATQ